MKLVPPQIETEKCLTLIELIDRLNLLLNDTPGDFHVHYCTEHIAVKKGGFGQIQEGIRDIAVSKRQGVVILLAESFR